ncbi:hypothetical protein WA1_36715 [Scytonema hofmannii PCC 7110]|uniref:Uncharacterized protein n=1 Tax=Scytonema hofmannii PCC 7110 TaxID=128403 RepID=A0A139X1Z4_9CYAN|nr:hypothetical protein [Scytonema hofmannii]KYC38715.1 hypothetical protein WA1_36715 [Scytonema hofmannii PCC 7110]
MSANNNENYDDEEMSSGGQKGEKGKSFRGGKKKKRDNWYGYNDKDFQKWWHRIGKEEFGGRDTDNAQQAKEVYEYWELIGKPIIK